MIKLELELSMQTEHATDCGICRNVHATLPAALLFLAVFSKHPSSRSTNGCNVLDKYFLCFFSIFLVVCFCLRACFLLFER